MGKKPRIAISIGDLNGVGLEIALKAHKKISKYCTPLYCIDDAMLTQGAKLLGVVVPKDFQTISVDKSFQIKPAKVSKKSGSYSYKSFLKAIELAQTKQVDGITTLPIHKEAWAKAGIDYKGHTDMLRDIFKKEAIMMLGKPNFFVALYTEHIPLKEVPKQIKTKKLTKFFLAFASSIQTKKVAILGLNPHAGDNGVLGHEERFIQKAIKKANKTLNKELFDGVFVPDIAFTPTFRKRYSYYIAMYHDQGLAPLKALYFDESINVSLNLPIIRTSVDHGTAFDIAYQNKAKTKSYQNAIKMAIRLSKG